MGWSETGIVGQLIITKAIVISKKLLRFLRGDSIPEVAQVLSVRLVQTHLSNQFLRCGDERPLIASFSIHLRHAAATGRDYTADPQAGRHGQ